jgi:hypothetical protein
LSEIKATLEAAYTISKNKFNLFELTEFDDIMGLSFDGENWF